MSIALASEKPEVQHKGARANFRWTLVEPWDERRLAAFLMTKHRRNESDWTRRASPFFASLGQSRDRVLGARWPTRRSLPELERLLTAELQGNPRRRLPDARKDGRRRRLAGRSRLP